MTEGIDLKDSSSRFQILVKVPYPDLKDERIKKRKRLDPDFYRFKTANTIIQSIGRSVRSESDYAVTFTLDSRFESFTRKNPDLMALYTRHVRDDYEMLGLKEFKNKDTKFISKLLKHIPRKSERRN